MSLPFDSANNELQFRDLASLREPKRRRLNDDVANLENHDAFIPQRLPPDVHAEEADLARWTSHECTLTAVRNHKGCGDLDNVNDAALLCPNGGNSNVMHNMAYAAQPVADTSVAELKEEVCFGMVSCTLTALCHAKSSPSIRLWIFPIF
jgi:hypothetical protein